MIKPILTSLSLFVLLFIFGSCENEKTKTEITLPTVETSQVNSVTSTTAVAGGTIVKDGGGIITSRGVCFSIYPEPNIFNYKVEEGKGLGSFICGLTGLTPNKLYYCRAFAINEKGPAYGNEITFTTPPVGNVTKAVVITLNPVSVAPDRAVVGGSVTADGGSPILSRGICYSLTDNPTMASPKTSDGTGRGNFSSEITNLTADTTYYYRAYATNILGVSYGDIKSFKTTSSSGGTLAIVTTTTASLITSTSATVGGEVTGEGGSSVTSRGVCYSTSPNPDVTGTKTSNGSGNGTFTGSLTGLQANTRYFYRAYATNGTGTSYGSEKEFTTLP